MHKILIANRGEIAVRVVRACRDLGLGSVAIFSECDRAARHVRMADEAVAIGGNAPADSYLRIDRILDAARVTGADAVHPGYGFLSENEDFARACRDAGLTFIGPTPEAVARVGSKTTARQIAASAGVPVVPGTEQPFGPDASDADIAAAARANRIPRADQGGGRRWRQGDARRVEPRGTGRAPCDWLARRRPRRLATRPSISSVACCVPVTSRFRSSPTITATSVPFVERECSIQRRHQKVIEESPSPVVDPALRARLAEAAVAVAKAAGYTNAGTVEFLLDEDGQLLLPRGECAAPGRASGDGDGRRRGPRAVADSHRETASGSRCHRTTR